MTWQQPSIITYKHCTYFLVFFSEALKENFLSVADMPTSKMFYIKMHTGVFFKLCFDISISIHVDSVSITALHIALKKMKNKILIFKNKNASSLASAIGQ